MMILKIPAILVFCFLLLTGCAVEKVISPSDFQESQRLVDQGTFFLRQGKFAEARAAFSMAREISGSPIALDGLGCVAMLEGRYEVAQRYFISAYQKDNQYTNALANLALLYELYGYSAEAETLYRQVLGEEPRNFRARNNFAAFMHDNGHQYDIVVSDELNKAFSLTPHPLIKANLSLIDRREYGSDKKEK